MQDDDGAIGQDIEVDLDSGQAVLGGCAHRRQGVLRGQGAQAAAMTFLIFNLLCAPCFAAIGAIRREMNNGKWTLFAVGYMTIFAYIVSFIVFQIGALINGGSLGGASVVAIIFALIILFFLFRPNPNANDDYKTVKTKTA